MTAPSGDAGPDIAGAVAALLRDVPDFPKLGIMFKDIAPLLADGAAFGHAIGALADHARACGPVDLVAGVEARGFLVAGALSRELGCGLVAVRKAGKLPPPTVRRSYDLEYGSAELEVPMGVLDGTRVFLVDDVLATGGTVEGIKKLVEQLGGGVVGTCFIIELTFLDGRKRLEGTEVHALITY